MGKKLYVGHLPATTNEEELRSVFEEGGRTVEDVAIALDPATGQRRSFAIVTMSTETDAAEAVDALDGQKLGGQALTVKVQEEPRRREARSR
ncbi:RNA recognition motif domain-containing protein [Streptomyces sp. NPDC059985]|uniref:RNA recognition motif domain-containing protein n=1 Tax=Streptomyces sp. NPDC059985 TaxID=3347025 RepID=UPI0036C9DE35